LADVGRTDRQPLPLVGSADRQLLLPVGSADRQLLLPVGSADRQLLPLNYIPNCPNDLGNLGGSAK